MFMKNLFFFHLSLKGCFLNFFHRLINTYDELGLRNNMIKMCLNRDKNGFLKILTFFFFCTFYYLLGEKYKFLTELFQNRIKFVLPHVVLGQVNVSLKSRQVYDDTF